MRVLGVDPGYERLGVAILEGDKNRQTVLYSSCIETSRTLPHEKRLGIIGKEIAAIIETYSPDFLAIETLFFNKNQKTALRVSEARGVVIHEAAEKKIPVYEYTPLQIKIAVTGYGRGTKEQVE